jgi:hypothetical protein
MSIDKAPEFFNSTEAVSRPESHLDLRSLAQRIPKALGETARSRMTGFHALR